MNHIREKIRIERLSKGYTQEYMAEQLGIGQRTYSKLECGNIKLSVKRLQKIADILEIDIKDLL